MATTKAPSACWRCSATLRNTAGRNNLIITQSRHEAIEEQLFCRRSRDRPTAGRQELLARLEEGKPDAHLRYEQDVVWPRFAAMAEPKTFRYSPEQRERARKAAGTRPDILPYNVSR